MQENKSGKHKSLEAGIPPVQSGIGAVTEKMRAPSPPEIAAEQTDAPISRTEMRRLAERLNTEIF